MGAQRIHAMAPASLRGQFTVAFCALALLIAVAGAVAVVTLRGSVAEMRQLTEQRLARMQQSHELLQHTLLIERRNDELIAADSAPKVAQAYGSLVLDLDAFDESVQRLAASSDDEAVLDLHQSSQLLRNSVTVVAQLHRSELKSVAQGSAAVPHHAMERLREELRRQVDALASAAQTQSTQLTRDYRDAVRQLADTMRHMQYSVMALVAACLAFCALIAHLLSRHVLHRLQSVSRRLLTGVPDPLSPVQILGSDELSRMAQAVERFLQDRHELELRTAELASAQQRLAAQNIDLQREVQVRQRAEALRTQQSQVLELIATNVDLPVVLDRLCRLIESQLDGTLTSVLLLSEDGTRLRHGAAPSLPSEYSAAIDGVSIGPAVGSCGTAAYRREPVIVRDIQTDPLWSDYRALAATHGLGSCWSTPILSHERAVLGTFALYGHGPRTPSSPERELVDLVAHLAGIAIERNAAQARIHHLAHHDALTGLPNRVLLQDRLQSALLQAERRGCSVTVAFIDLDHFKLINDSLGHGAGDELLREAAQRLQRWARSSDTVVRLGGDEFLIVFSDQPADPAAMTLRLHTLRAEMAEPVQLGGRTLQITCSIGAATYPADAKDAEELLMNADAALYRAKDLGRDNFQFYTADLNSRLNQQLSLHADLRHAIEREQLLLLYQPLVDVRSGRVFGAEALLRWQHPVHGLMSPSTFIPLAEKSGLIAPIGDWVLRTACRQNKAWQDAGLWPITVAVNVSARQFSANDWVPRVARALEETGLAPNWLDLELTESMIMDNEEAAMARMDQLKAMGVGLAIDDFGTGYSSLGALKAFPIDRLKIDKSFVRNLPADNDERAIVSAIIELGHKMSLRVLAEGVETQAQLDFLRASGCDEMQGYLRARPMPAGEFERLLAAASHRSSPPRPRCRAPPSGRSPASGELGTALS